MGIRDRLIEIREEFKLNKDKMAAVLGMRQSTYRALENGYLVIKDKYIERISETLFVSSDWFKTGEGQMFANEEDKEKALMKIKESKDKPILDPQSVAIAQRLKELRLDLGLSQVDIAEKLSITTNAYFRIEAAQVKMSARYIYMLCTLYNVSPKWLLDGEGEMYVTETAEQQLLTAFKQLPSDMQWYIVKMTQDLLDVVSG